MFLQTLKKNCPYNFHKLALPARTIEMHNITHNIKQSMGPQWYIAILLFLSVD